MQKELILLMVLVTMLAGGCVSKTPGHSGEAPQTVQTRQLHTAEFFYPNGHLKEKYTYYLDADNHQVRHGKREIWEENGLMGTEEVYEDGRLVRTSFLSKNY